MASQFTSESCLQANFQTEVSHEGEFWGLLKSNLKVEKSDCLITIEYKRILKDKWKVDVCREPVHLKYRSKGRLQVFKRNDGCSGQTSEYCSSMKELLSNVQDFGLIFAEGERESLSTGHGMVYCSFLLLKKYLEEGEVLSKYDNSIRLFIEEDSTSTKNHNQPQSDFTGVQSSQPLGQEPEDSSPSF